MNAIEEVEFCDCTNEELERGVSCTKPQCPNAGRPDDEQEDTGAEA